MKAEESKYVDKQTFFDGCVVDLDSTSFAFLI